MLSFSSLDKVLISAVLTIVVCIVFGNNLVAKLLNAFTEAGADIFTPNSPKSRTKLFTKLSLFTVALGYVAVFAVGSFADLFKGLCQ